MKSKETCIKVEGMTCSSCAMGLQKQLEKKGLENVDVSFSTGEAFFINTVDLSNNEILETIAGAGFEGFLEEQEEKSGLSKIEKYFYFSLVFTLPLFFHMFVSEDSLLNNFWVQLCLATPVFFVGVIHFGRSAWNSLKSLAPNMDVLIFTGSTAAYIYSIAGYLISENHIETHKYLFFETTASIITLVLLGNLLEKKSVNQTTTALKDLMKLQHVFTKRIKPDGSIEEVNSKELIKDDIVIVNKGDQIPADGILFEGSCIVDESMITGESIGVDKNTGDSLIGGTINQGESIKVKITDTGRETVLSKIIQLVKNAQNDKPEIQRLGDKVSNVFVPVVISISLLTFTLSYLAFDVSLSDSLMRSIAVLVISCPCAMGLATPTAVMAGLGRAAKNGILVKGGQTLEQLTKVNTFVFDKTGTLTTGEFKIENLETTAVNQEFINLVYTLEQNSSHPIAKSLIEELNGNILNFESINEIKGKGMTGTFESNEYFLGKVHDQYTSNKTLDINLWKNKEWIGGFNIVDELKPQTKELIDQLQSQGIEAIILSGDKKEKVEQVAKTLNISNYYFEKLPEEKLNIINDLSKSRNISMIGDGINDAPALAKSMVGFSFSDATQVAIQEAQVVLLKNDMNLLKEAHLISTHTLKTIKQNLFWAFFYNVVAIPIAAFGFLVPMYAALAMAFSDVIVIGNSIRLKNKRLS